MDDGVQVLEATRRDVDDIVRVHTAAFPQSALTRLGAGAVRRYYSWQFDGPHDLVALLGAADGAVEGFCIGGTFRGALGGFVQRNRAYLVLRVLRRPWLAGDPMFRGPLVQGWRAVLRSRPTASTHGEPNGHRASFGVLSIAVSPSHHGTGLAQALLQASEHEARARGYERMHLTVGPRNQRAIAFYEKNGWSTAPRDGVWNGSMTKTLR